MADYGDATVVRDEDGTVRVERADPVIGISAQLLAEAVPWMYGPDGLLWLDPTGEYRYRPARLHYTPLDPTETARVIVFERVEHAP